LICVYSHTDTFKDSNAQTSTHIFTQIDMHLCTHSHSLTHKRATHTHTHTHTISSTHTYEQTFHAQTQIPHSWSFSDCRMLKDATKEKGEDDFLGTVVLMLEVQFT